MSNPKFIIFVQNVGINFRPLNTIEAFEKLGISKWAMLLHYYELKDILIKYYQGDPLHAQPALTTRQFRQKIKELFPNESKNWTDEKFDNAWNAMFEITDKTPAFFDQTARLSQAGLHVYVAFYINPLHIQKMGLEIPKKANLLNFYYSCVLGKNEDDILKDVFKDCAKTNSVLGLPAPEQSDVIVVHPAPPKLTWWQTFLGWLTSPIVSLIDYYFKSNVENLHFLAKNSKKFLPMSIGEDGVELIEKLQKNGTLTKRHIDLMKRLQRRESPRSSTAQPPRQVLVNYSLRSSPGNLLPIKLESEGKIKSKSQLKPTAKVKTKRRSMTQGQ